MIPRHSPIVHAAYRDLLGLLLDEAVSEIRGTPTAVTRKDRTYWYDAYRVGSDVRRRYIGEDSPGIRARIERHREAAAAAGERRAARARLVRLLRAERLLGIDAGTGSLLAAFAGAGVFRLGGTVVGTHAFRLYEAELGVRYTLDQTATTRDVDIASFERLSVALGEAIEPAMPDLLAGFAFEPVPGLDPAPAWRWRQSRGDAVVEFLTPSFEADEGLRPIPTLGVAARALHHLNYLIAEPIPAAALYRAGVLVQVPRPERFAIHKLIVADRRRDGPDAAKAVKDRLQARFLVEILAEDRPDDLKEAYGEAMAAGPQWQRRIAATLKRLPDVAERLAGL